MVINIIKVRNSCVGRMIGISGMGVKRTRSGSSGGALEIGSVGSGAVCGVTKCGVGTARDECDDEEIVTEGNSC